MPTATYPPRCPHRYWQTLLFVSLLGTTTATVSLHGQEISLLDYRLIDPVGHMQPWPYVESEVSITPAKKTPIPLTRIATKWQTEFSEPLEEKVPIDENKLPGPVLEEPSLGETESGTEVLVLPTTPKEPTEKSPKTKQQPTTKQRDCYQALPLSAMSVSIALPKGKLPTNAAAECVEQNRPTEDIRLVGSWACTEHRWSATCTRHRPLYFEEINAERYGYTVSYALQPVISAAHFFGSIPALPYKMAVEPPRECIYTLGHYRPGSCAPRRSNCLPWQPNAGVVEVGFIAGMILLIP